MRVIGNEGRGRVLQFPRKDEGRGLCVVSGGRISFTPMMPIGGILRLNMLRTPLQCRIEHLRAGFLATREELIEEVQKEPTITITHEAMRLIDQNLVLLKKTRDSFIMTITLESMGFSGLATPSEALVFLSEWSRHALNEKYEARTISLEWGLYYMLSQQADLGHTMPVFGMDPVQAVYGYSKSSLYLHNDRKGGLHLCALNAGTLIQNDRAIILEICEREQ